MIIMKAGQGLPKDGRPCLQLQDGHTRLAKYVNSGAAGLLGWLVGWAGWWSPIGASGLLLPIMSECLQIEMTSSPRGARAIISNGLLKARPGW